MKKLLVLSFVSLSFTACTNSGEIGASDGNAVDSFRKFPNPHKRDMSQPPEIADLAQPSSPPSSSPDLASAPADMATASSPPDLAKPPAPADMSSGTTTSSFQLTDVVPPSGPAGTAITVLGSGFQTGDTVQISSSSLAAITLTTVSLTATAIMATIPTSVAPSQLTVAVKRGTTRSSTTGVFQVTSGHVYYLSPSGSDSASGSMSSPWRSLSKAFSSVTAGDLVYLRGGTYSGGLSVHISGTASAPIVFQGFPGERAVVSTSSGDTLSVYGAYLTWDHLAFTSSGAKAFTLATGSSHNVISNCELFNSYGQGLMLAGDNDLVENNLIHDNGTVVGHDHGIYIEGASNIVRGNTIYNNNSCGIQLYNGYGRIAGNNLIERNYVYHNSYPSAAAGHNYSAAIMLATAQPNTIVRYNVLCDNARLAVYEADSSVTGNQVTNNVSCYNHGNGYLFDVVGSGTKFLGNISYNDSGAALSDNTTLTSDNNTYFKVGGTPSFVYHGSTMSLASFRTASGQDAHSQIADPKFTSLSSTAFDWTKASSYDFCTSLIPALCD